MKPAVTFQNPSRGELYARIDARLDRMIEQGALEEAAALAGLDLSLPAAKILGLRELRAVNAGTICLEEAKAAAKQATRQYAKRQLTWFRNRMADWQWIKTAETNDFVSAMSRTLAI